MGEARQRRRPLLAVSAGLLAVLVLAGAAALVVRGGLAHPAERARVEAEDGYDQWSVPFTAEAAERQAALESVLGAPIGETWYIICSGIVPGGPKPAAQVCSLEVSTTYAIDWTTPHADISETVTALQGTDATTGDELTSGRRGPWTAIPVDGDTEPRGKVAEAGTNGSVYVYAPGAGPVALDTLPPVLGLFPDGVLKAQTVPESEPSAGHGQVVIRRSVGISRTNIGCVPQASLRCGSLLKAPAMPRIDGFS